jgi:hypothetical protein
MIRTKVERELKVTCKLSLIKELTQNQIGYNLQKAFLGMIIIDNRRMIILRYQNRTEVQLRQRLRQSNKPERTWEFHSEG